MLAYPANAGEPVLWAQLEGRRAPTFSTRLSPGRRAVTVPVDEISSLSGMVEPGDLIDIVVSVKKDSRSFTFTLLQSVPVLATGAKISQQEKDPEGRARSFTTITLDTSPEDAKRVIAEPNAGRLAVGNGKSLSAAVLDDREILLIANEPGVSSLHIWTRDGRNRRLKVNIGPGESARVAREIAAFLAAIPNSKAAVIGDKVIVEGDNLSDRDLAKIDELAKRYPQIVNFTNRIGWERMIVMDVKVVEFPTTALREIGLKWGAAGGVAVGGIWMPIRRGDDGPYQIDVVTGQNNRPPISNPAGSGGVLLTSSLNILSAVNLGLNAQLNLMQQNGTATILAQPTLSTRSGARASFLAGGEFPYAVSNINGTTIQFKPYGIRLDIEPRVDHNGVIRARIMSEVSDIDTSIASIGGPALRTRKTETEFNVMEGGTIVLSGLLRRDLAASLDKVPGLGDIPILGALFRSKRFQNNETELVVFVTPVAVDQHSLAQQRSLDQARARLDAAPRAAVPDLAAVPGLAPPAQTAPGQHWRED